MTPANVLGLRPGTRVGTAQGDVEVVRVVDGGQAIIGRYLGARSPALVAVLGPRPGEGRIPHNEIGSVR